MERLNVKRGRTFAHNNRQQRRFALAHGKRGDNWRTYALCLWDSGKRRGAYAYDDGQ